MAAWANPPLVVYHGTDVATANVMSMGLRPSLAFCLPLTDFGQGFYTTTRLHQAKQWPNTKVLRLRQANPAAGAAVIAYTLDRTLLARLASLTFVRESQDFWQFVASCRSQHPPPHRFRGFTPPLYDAVHGPVTLWPQKLVIKDCDQLSFHTRRGLAILSRQGNPKLVSTATGNNGLFR